MFVVGLYVKILTMYSYVYVKYNDVRMDLTASLGHIITPYLRSSSFDRKT